MGNGLLHNPEAVARRRKALEMHVQGATTYEIGDALGISRQAAYRLVDRALKRELLPTIEAARKVSLKRVAKATRLAMSLIEEGSADGIDKLVKCEERTGKLLGLDAPTKSDAVVRTAAIVFASDEEELEFYEAVAASVRARIAAKAVQT